MTVHHATHPSPFDETCPDCTGFTDDYRAESRDASRRALLVIVVLAAVVLVAAYLLGRAS